MSRKSRSVTIAAAEVTTRDGKTHPQGATVSLPDVEARDLIRAGRARAAGPGQPVPEPVSVPEPATDSKAAAKLAAASKTKEA